MMCQWSFNGNTCATGVQDVHSGGMMCVGGTETEGLGEPLNIAGNLKLLYKIKLINNNNKKNRTLREELMLLFVFGELVKIKNEFLYLEHLSLRCW